MLPAIFALALVQPPAATNPVHLSIRAQISLEPARVVGRATVTVPRAALADPSRLRLQTGLTRGRHIEIGAAGDSGARTIAFSYSSDSSQIEVPTPGGGPTVTVMLDFATPLDTTARRQLGYFLEQSTSDDEAWYPAPLDLPDSLARFRSFDLHLEVPPRTALLATGTLIDSVASTAGMAYLYQASDVEGAALAIGPGYRIETEERDGVRVRALTPAADTRTFARIASAAADAMGWYRTTFGFFPTREIGIVPGYRGARGGFPLPNVFMIHQGDLTQPFVRWITAHELAHYYWGLHVLDADERLGWLTLGLGIWTDQLFLARTSNRSIEAQWRDRAADNAFERLAEAMAGNYDQRLGLPTAEADSLEYDYNSLVRHAKGATGIYLLAARLGPDRFTALLRGLLDSHRHRALSLSDFATALERAGAAGAARFLAAWIRPDARLDYTVRAIRADRTVPGRTVVTVERTGTIPFPVTVAARTARGATGRVELTGEAATDSAVFVLDGPIVGVEIDPDGKLPMATSDHREMRRVFLRGAGAAGPATQFLAMAEAHLRADPDPYLAALVIERQFEIGDFAAVFRTAQRFPAAVQCVDRPRCLAALQVARSLVPLGKLEGARAWLRNVEGATTSLGLTNLRRLREAKAEIDPPR